MKILLRQVMTWLLLAASMVLLRLSVPAFTSAGSDLRDAIGEHFHPADPELLGAATTLSFILVGSWLSGLIVKHFGLPKITGYLLFGMLFGPSVAPVIFESFPTLLPGEQLQQLRLVSGLAIALIGLTAGGEIHVRLFRKGFGAIAKIVIIEMVAVFIAVSLALYVARGQLSFLEGVGGRESLALISAIGVIAIANSPAIMVVMLVETQAKGPMSETGLAVTVIKDLCLVIVFTIVSALGVAAVANEGGETGAREIILHLAWHLLGSMAIGAGVGAFMAPLVNQVGKNLPLLIIGVALAIALVSEALSFEPLLVSLTAGFVLANVFPERSAPLFHSIEELSLPVYCVFFAATGAVIDVETALKLWPAALLIVAVRTIAVWGGTTLGARMAGTPEPARKWLWLAFIPQAGIAIALTASVAQSYAEMEWAASLQSLLLAMIAVNVLLGPVLLRWGLMKAGEIEA